MLDKLPDEILLRIFSYLLDVNTYHSEHFELTESSEGITSTSASAISKEDQTLHEASFKKKPKKRGRKAVLADSPARTLCRLCCCSKRLNHIASANQLWQTLTLDRFPNRHWPQTDPKKLELVRVQREHQRVIANVTQSSTVCDKNMVKTTGDGGEYHKDGLVELASLSTPTVIISTTNATTIATKKRFYSRFEQRAFRRKFSNLDPELKYTPLLWTNTFWSWKRTYFGDCRFLEAQEVATPNCIDRSSSYIATQKHEGEEEAQRRDVCSRCWRPPRSCICSALPQHTYCNCRVRVVILQHPRCQVSIGTIRILKTCFKYCDIFIGKDFSAGVHPELDRILDNPRCTPFLLYPSHDAIDIHKFAVGLAQPFASSPMIDKVERADESAVKNGDTTIPAQFFCNDCIHYHCQQQNTMNDMELPEPSLPYSYRTVIALDGSWSHAKILYRFNPRLQQLTNVLFPQPPRSIYHDLKPEPKATYTSTVEAVGQAVALLGWSSRQSLSFERKQQQTTIAATTIHPDNATLLMESLIRPLRKMIEIQDTIQLDRLQQERNDKQRSQTNKTL